MINKINFPLLLKITLIVLLILDILYKIVLIKLNVQFLLNLEEIIFQGVFIVCLIKYKRSKTFNNIFFLLTLNILFSYIYAMDMIAFDKYSDTLDFNFLYRSSFCFLELFINNTFCSVDSNDIRVIAEIDKESVPVLFGIVDEILKNQKDFSISEISQSDLFELLYPPVDRVTEILNKTDYYLSFGLESEELAEILQSKDYDKEAQELDEIIRRMSGSIILGGVVSNGYEQFTNYNEAWSAKAAETTQTESPTTDDFIVNVDPDMLKNTLLESRLNQDLLRVNTNKAHELGNELLEIEKVITNASDYNRLNIHDFNLINSLHIKKVTLVKSLVSTTAHLKVIKSGQLKLLVTLGSFFLG